MRKKNKKVGIFIGKFLPPHIGHINQIWASAEMCDEFFVVLADSTERSKQLCKQSSIPLIAPKQRLAWLKNIFRDNKKIKVKIMNCGMLESYPNKLNEWKNILLKTTRHKHLTWFVDNEFLEISKKTFPEFEFVGFNRTNINISASEIRKKPKNFINYLPEEVYSYFNKINKNV